MQIDISIIIPCFNSGSYIMEAINSVKAYKGQRKYEIIIIDDGSTESETLGILEQLRFDNLVHVFYQENKGPAGARNAGVRQSRASFILFLDSDNSIIPGYIDVGIDLLQKNEEIGVVYAKCNFFGDSVIPTFSPKEFDPYDILVGNAIDMCSVVRKETWQDVNGFDENRFVIGREDWLFWIKISATKWKFKFVDEVLFNYRIRANSLMRSAKDDERLYRQQLREYIFSNNQDLIIRRLHELVEIKTRYKFDQKNPFRTLIRLLLKKFYN